MNTQAATTDEASVFSTLSAVEVRSKVRQKGNFWYVSWSIAVREMLKKFPDSNWEFTSYEGLPYLKTEVGYFVECAVTVNNITRKQMMPILDNRNQVEMSPDAAQVNKAQMRALTKAIALHGFGLDLWAGEDLDAPEGATEQPAKSQKKPFGVRSLEIITPALQKHIQSGSTLEEFIQSDLAGYALTDNAIAKLREVANAAA